MDDTGGDNTGGDDASAIRYWLIKSEPEAFSWAQQMRNRIEPWTGVRNHAAKHNLRAMRRGDQAFFYHSNTGRQIVGIVTVAREAYPDPTAEAGDWVAVDMRAHAALPAPVSLAAMKSDPMLSGLALLRHSRLSVVPVSAAHWHHLCRCANYHDQDQRQIVPDRG